jgi:hypothetical protein
MSSTPDATGVAEKKLPRRDWVLLPLLSLITIVLIAGSTELLGWWLFPWSGVHSLEHDCIVRNDPSTGVRGVPNTACWDKIAETKPVLYKLNSCGFRTIPCGPKPPGTYRVVMIGSSLAMGMRVPVEQSIGSLLPVELSKETGRKVELYNEGFAWGSPHTIDLRFDAVLKAQPDLILWIITPYDVKKPTMLFPDGFGPSAANAYATKPAAKRTGFIANAWRVVRARFASKSFSAALQAQWDQTRTSLMLRHYLYKSQDRYIKSYLANEDESGYLKAQPDAVWQDHIKNFETVAGRIESRAEAAGVPIAATFVPLGAHAAMISMGKWPAGYAPYELDDTLRTFITSQGGIYIDILPDFRNIPNPEKYFLPVDTHPIAQGQAIISEMLAKELSSGAVPALKAENKLSAALSEKTN